MVEKRGAAQMVLIGFTNSGRSTLLAKLTNAKPSISPNPFTTMRPVEGMMEISGTQIQIVEAPPLILEAQGGPTNLAVALAKNSDVLGITVSSLDDPLDSLSKIFSLLESREISLERPTGRVRIKRSKAAPALIIMNKGRLVDCSEGDVRELLLQFGIDRAWVEIEGYVKLEDVEEAIFGEKSYKPAIIFLTKYDIVEDKGLVEEVKKLYGDKVMGIIPSPTGLPSKEELGEMILKELGLIRVFTKSKNEKYPSDKAVILSRNSSVIDLAELIHESFRERFKYAKVWAKRLPYSPMRVGPDFLLEDGDVVEIVVG
jgi:ribosome-interacting GTPase 1